VECCGCDYRNGKTKGVRKIPKGFFTPKKRRMIKNRITGDPILADPYGRDYQMADGIIIRLRRNSRI